ncbi:TetR family transcriptional regulator C-terminal domain-containing protein [Paraburkholderia sp. EG286B]|uniref:TetR/AcrR family transcriptional regulator n=1 Tax=Paraburkholderia sp. EG286B TaxID=3237011 RepID=UPI0034D2FF9D
MVKLANIGPNKRGIETRAKLLAAGAAEFHAHGFNGVGIDVITKAAGVPKGSFYNLFESKEAFAVEAIEHYFGIAEGKMLKFFDDNRTFAPLDRLRGYFRALIDHYVKLHFRRGCMLGNLTLEAADQSDFIREMLAANFRQWSATLAQAIKEAQTNGDIKNPTPASVLADFTLNSWEGALVRMKVEKSVAPLEEMTDVIFKSVLV